MNKIAKEAIWAAGPRKLAAHLGATDGTVYAWLRGKSVPRLSKLKDIQKFLGKKSKVTLEDLTAQDEHVESPDRRTLPKAKRAEAANG